MNVWEWRIREINMILHIRQNSGRLRQFKQRRDYGLTFVRQGTIRFDYEDATYEVDSNRILLISKDIDYSITFESMCSFYVINFDLEENLPDFTFHTFDVPVYGKMADFLKQLCIDWDFRQDDAQRPYISRVYQLLVMIDPSGPFHADICRTNSAIAPSIEYLKEHYTDPDISNDQLAQISNVSTVYFRKIFTRQFGQSPMSYIRHQRIEHAKTLLRSDYYESITDVAHYSGFRSLYHFSKTFRQLVGMSPSEYLSSSELDYESLLQSNATPTGKSGSKTSRR